MTAHPSNPPAPRWRRLPEERPRQIIDAAFAAFGTHGLQGARLDQIARSAGVSKGTIYLYFQSKEDLFRAVVEAVVISAIEAAEADAARADQSGDSAAQALQRYIRAHWEYLRSPDFQAMYRLVHGELANFPDLARFYGTEVIERSLRVTAGVVERGVRRGEFRDVDPMDTARVIHAILLSHAVWLERRQVFQTSMCGSPDEIRDKVINFVFFALAPSTGVSPDATSSVR
jgi:AcrR family transcriptional regulator